MEREMVDEFHRGYLLLVILLPLGGFPDRSVRTILGLLPLLTRHMGPESDLRVFGQLKGISQFAHMNANEV
jgi:hypothetical protein